MARPTRWQVEDGWYYVTSRGQGGQPIFLDVADGTDFMERLEEFPTRFGIEVHGYVLLPNHYHLLLHTPRGNLSRGVQWLNTGYGIWWNHRHRREGHVFRGRFKSVMIENGPWLLELSFYLHLNPVALQRDRSQSPDSAATTHSTPRLDILRSWRWSSYRAYAGLQEVPDWLQVQEIRDRLDGGAERYRERAESRLDTASASPWKQVEYSQLLGSRPFIEQQLRAKRVVIRQQTQKPEPAAILNRIITWVEQHRGFRWNELCEMRGDWARDLAWWGARRFGDLTFREISTCSPGTSLAAVAKAVARFEAALERDPVRAKSARALGHAFLHEPIS